MSSEKIQINIDGRGQKISFPHGPSFFSAHQLPELDGPLRLKVISELNPGDFIPSSLMIYPYVTALTHEYELIESVPLAAVRYHTGFLGGSGVLWTYEAPKDTKYVIFHTAKEKFGGTYSVRGASSGVMAGTVVTMSEGGVFQVPFAPTGTLSVEFDDSGN